MRDPGFGIYVHWPFCSAKCPYCDFNSHVRTSIDETAWTEAIISELEWVAARQGADRPVLSTVFFGGGTPSLMSGHAVGSVLDCIAKNWRITNNIEVTLEANPASADAGRFRDYRVSGVNRLSLGVQALNDADLKMLGRLHNADEARAALETAMTEFSRVSCDLIYARPGQTPDAWKAELEEALSFGTDHLSLYQLTIEPATPFAMLAHTGALVVPGDEDAAVLYEITQDLTEAAGRLPYEISNHALPGEESRHNLLYWRYGAYAGVGPGAHGRLDLDGKRFATAAERLPERWRERVMRDGNGFVEMSEVTKADAAREHLLMNLRLSEGLDLVDYRARWDTVPDTSRIVALEQAGFVRMDGTRLTATAKGRLVLNALIAELV